MTSPHPSSEWQRIWFGIRQQAWTSLAVVPSHAGIDVASVAEALAATGRMHAERVLSVIDATGVQLENVQRVVDSITAAADRGESVIVPVDSVPDNPSAIALIQATSSALLVLRLGESLMSSAQTTLDAVGREKFIGTVVVDGSGFSVKPDLSA